MKSEAKHTTLYRQYRPQDWDEVRGQPQVTDVLQKAIKNKKISHAYLFAGSRGTGKTTVARILARSLGVSDKDLYEIDAASNRGIDDIRELRSGVYAIPFDSEYKFYIIDEVHMLTKEAWNALLKMLEEPPTHAIFVLATTERHKVPDTILSRCEVYVFKQPTREVLSGMITDVAKSEGFSLERSASELIALLAEGSFRDALGILQKVLVVSKNKKVEIAEVEEVSGAPRGELIRELLRALAMKDAPAGIKAVAAAIEQNLDMRTLMKLLLERVRVALLMRHAPDLSEAMKNDLSDDDWKLAHELSKDKSAQLNSNTLRRLLDAYAEMSYAAVPHLPLELAVIDICAKAA